MTVDEDRVREQRREENTGVRAFHRCGICLDVGFVETDAAGRGTVHPCPRCRAETHARWAEGAYRPTKGDRPMTRKDD